MNALSRHGLKSALGMVYLMISILSASGQIFYTITDPRDGKVYRVVRIGEQWWMAQNLNVGERVDNNYMQEDNNLIEKYCPYDYESYCDEYGGLYQWNELMQYGNVEFNRGICPGGWHVSSDDEWKELELFLGMDADDLDIISQEGIIERGWMEGGMLKSAGTTQWVEPNSDATDAVGFSALPAGLTNLEGDYGFEGVLGLFWCADEYNSSFAWFRSLSYIKSTVFRNADEKDYGISARCIKDSPYMFGRGKLTDPRDDQQYETVLIGNHWWMAENLNVGTWIDTVGDQTDNAQIQKYCYDDQGYNCTQFGGLYQWNEMMNYNPEDRQGICPDGWHIPGDNEWKELEFAAGMAAADLNKMDWRGSTQGAFLQEGGGSGFEVLLGGGIDPSKSSIQKGYLAYLWTSDANTEQYAWARIFQADKDGIHRNDMYYREDAFSVRCVNDANAVLSLSIEADDNVCPGSNVTLSAVVTGGSDNITYSWTSSPPGFVSSASQVVVPADTNVRYKVQVIDGYILESDSIVVSVKPAPAIAVYGMANVCPTGEAFEYTAVDDPDYSYIWNTTDGTIQSIIRNKMRVVWGTDAGTKYFSLQMRDNISGCASQKNYRVEVLSPPVNSVSPLEAVCPSPENLEYTAIEFPDYSYVWSTADGTIQSVNHNKATIGWGMSPGIKNLSLQVTDDSTGCVSLKNYQIDVREPPPVPVIVLKGESLLICPDSGFIYQWYHGTAPISGGNKQFYYAKGNKTGDYIVEIKDNNTCKNTSEPYSFTRKSTDAGEDENYSTIFFRPNPTSGNLIMDIVNDYTGPVVMDIYNPMGQAITRREVQKSGAVFTTRLNIESLPEGTYILIVAMGERNETHRIIKQD